MSISTDSKPGSLIIAGSGIASIAHITLETVYHLKEAQKVFYAVCDPITESYIKKNNSDTFDLTVFYGKEKERYRSYVEMAEVMLRAVRAGHNVLGVFYGHPGVFVSPAHRALTIARREGYKARMLPGISSEDYLFADLQLEPAVYGCMSSEATELLAHNRSLNTSVYNIIWQVGSIGVTTMELENSKFQLLVDRLEEDFGSEHKLIHYSGAITPQEQSAMVTFTVRDLRNREVANQFTDCSIICVPPGQFSPTHPRAIDALGLPAAVHGILSTVPQWDGPRFVASAGYGDYEQRIVNELDQHTAPEYHNSLHASSAMQEFMMELALDPKLQEAYKADIPGMVNRISGLTDRERFALQLDHEGPVKAIMSRSTEEEPTEAQLKAITLDDSSTYPANWTPYAIAV